ncbi:Zinc finger CCCH-type [Pyrenophora seminiperda CCB06]|uniref:Zinc finger CCCH-type n=1 Tax=Pyrenophora seminiperda CCB06 TaxID=1302712 RepID=A0A3M7MHC7_9PLEO|nr:Zinc finger CCCH-type [Pyrenophora seminiperda CCB06]
MAKEIELELQALRRESKQLYRTLDVSRHRASAKYRVLVEKYINTTKRFLVKAKEEERRKNFFCQSLLHDNHVAGANAANLLRKAVNDELAYSRPEIAAEDYKLVVRLFISLMDTCRGTGSTIFPKAAKVPSMFLGGFTSADPAKAVPAKVRENLQLYMGNDQCKHIFLAASASQSRQVLRSYRRTAQKLTVVAGLDMRSEINALGLRAVAFPTVFSTTQPVAAAITQSMMSQNVTTTAKPARIDNTAKLSGISKTAATSVKISSATSPTAPHSKNSLAVLSYYYLSPHPIHDLVPINQAKQRLDTPTQLPTPADLKAYKACIATQNPCPAFHLQGKCASANCTLSHAMVAPGVTGVLAVRALGKPCTMGSACRIRKCMHAHICQQAHCAQAGGRVSGCGLPEAMHEVDPHVALWVSADDVEEFTDLHAR